jgi:hypothetical protein
MKSSKITKFLPVALALSLTVGSVYAGDVIQQTAAEQASVKYELNLQDYCEHLFFVAYLICDKILWIAAL